MKNKQIKKRMESKHFNGLMEVFKKKLITSIKRQIMTE